MEASATFKFEQLPAHYLLFNFESLEKGSSFLEQGEEIYVPFYKSKVFGDKIKEAKNNFPCLSSPHPSFTATLLSNADDLSSIPDLQKLESLKNDQQDPVAGKLLDLIKNYAAWHFSIQDLKKNVNIVLAISMLASAIFIFLGTPVTTTVMTVGGLGTLVLSQRLIKCTFIFINCLRSKYRWADKKNCITIYFAGTKENSARCRIYSKIRVGYHLSLRDIIEKSRTAC